jgi:DegV family protein with EDD domain
MALKIVTDSTSYLPAADVDRYGITVVPLSATLGGVTLEEPLIDPAAFYRQMRETGEFPTSSQPTLAVMIDALETPVAAGDEVAAVLLSSRMSGTFETALLARDQVLERHPEARIEIVDSMSNCMEEGFAVLAAARASAAGATLQEAVAAAKATIMRTRWLFVPATLEYLRLGGRIGSAAALLGSLLQVRPILTVVDGVTATVRSVRTQRRALEWAAEKVAADVAEFGFVDAVVHHILDPDEAGVLADLIASRIGTRPRVQQIGPAIGLHVGPGTVGVVYQTRDELGKNTVRP